MKTGMKVIIGLVLILLVSCAKEGSFNSTDCDINMENVAGTYKITAVKYKPSPTAAEIDFLDTYYTEPCEVDDLIVLNANGTALLKDVGVICNPSRDDSGTWSVTGNKLVSQDYIADIESLQCNEYMVLVINDIYTAGDKLRITYTNQ